MKPKNTSPSKDGDSPVKAPARKRARIIDSDEEDENNVEMPDDGGESKRVEEKTKAQRLEKVCEEKKQEVNGDDVGIEEVVGIMKTSP